MSYQAGLVLVTALDIFQEVGEGVAAGVGDVISGMVGGGYRLDSCGGEDGIEVVVAEIFCRHRHIVFTGE